MRTIKFKNKTDLDSALTACGEAESLVEIGMCHYYNLAMVERQAPCAYNTVTGKIIVSGNGVVSDNGYSEVVKKAVDLLADQLKQDFFTQN